MDMYYVKANLELNSEIDLAALIKVNDGYIPKKIKVFVWSDFNDMDSLCEYRELVFEQ